MNITSNTETMFFTPRLNNIRLLPFFEIKSLKFIYTKKYANQF
jgi:hypothetical protein